jgi:hypothetical protein
MVDERGIVALIYRADWRRLSLSGEVRGGDPMMPPLREMSQRLGWPAPPPSSGSPGETDRTLLVAPGGRYRVTTPRGQVWGCDGERSWARQGELPPSTEIRLGAPQPPFPELLEPSWLLTGYDLAVEGDSTACGRAAIRVVATARRRARDEIGGIPYRLPLGIRAGRVVAVVDAELGILLRYESQHGEQAPDIAEFRSLTVNLEPDRAWFTAPPGSIFADDSGLWRFGLPFGGTGTGIKVAKTAAGIAAAGLGAAIRYKPRRRPDPFARATEEAAEPDAAMPRDDGAAPSGTADPAAPAVRKKVLHLLYRSSADEPRFTAILHQWIDLDALLEAVPESARMTGFGGIGFLVDALRDAAPDSGNHQVSSVRIGGWDRYRIDVVGARSLGRDRHIRHPEPLTEACDGQRRWQVYKDRVVAGPAAPLPEKVAGLVDGSWLLRRELSGGEEVIIGGRRAYRLVGRRQGGMPWAVMDTLTMGFFPVVAAVDAESGRLLRLTSYAGGKPVLCRELRDITPDESGEFGFEPPAGLRIVEEEEPAQRPPNPAEFAAKAAGDAMRRFLGSLGRRG